MARRVFEAKGSLCMHAFSYCAALQVLRRVYNTIISTSFRNAVASIDKCEKSLDVLWLKRRVSVKDLTFHRIQIELAIFSIDFRTAFHFIFVARIYVRVRGGCDKLAATFGNKSYLTLIMRVCVRLETHRVATPHIKSPNEISNKAGPIRKM